MKKIASLFCALAFLFAIPVNAAEEPPEFLRLVEKLTHESGNQADVSWTCWSLGKAAEAALKCSIVPNSEHLCTLDDNKLCSEGKRYCDDCPSEYKALCAVGCPLLKCCKDLIGDARKKCCPKK